MQRHEIAALSRLSSHVLACILLHAVPTQAQADWPLLFSDPGNTRFVATDIVPSSFRAQAVWDITLPGNASALHPALLAEGRAIYLDRPDWKVRALDLATGQERWFWPPSSSSSDSISYPVVARGRVYVLHQRTITPQYRLIELDAASGALLRERPLTAAVRDCMLTAVGDHLYASWDGGSALQRWDLDTLTVLRYPQRAPAYGPIAAADSSRLYFQNEDRNELIGLHAFEQSTLARTFRIATTPGLVFESRALKALVLGSHGSVFTNESGFLIRYDLDDFSIGYMQADGYSGHVMHHDGRIYILSRRGINALDELTGQILWRSMALGDVSSLLAVTNDHVLVYGAPGRIVALDRRTGALAGSFAAPFGLNASVSQGLIVVGFGNRYIAYRCGFPPRITSVTPSAAPYRAGAALVEIQGSGFTSGRNLEIRFGDQPATELSIVSDQLVRCRAPQLEPGIYDLTVSTGVGRAVSRRAFASTPRLELPPDPRIGTRISLALESVVGDGHILVYGAPPAVAIATPPFAGVLAAFPFGVLTTIALSPTANVTLEVDVPNDPLLVGVPLLLQSLSGPLLLQLESSAWTNAETLLLR